MTEGTSKAIKIIGVGGGGGNAINHMFQAGINGVDFVILNTDSQALTNSAIPNKIQLGVSLTEGLGAGANPEVGEQAAIESMDELKAMLDIATKMVFITVGMGGGTGTGAAPVIAKLAKEMDILTVGIVTMPFEFEGKMRCKQAQLGIEKLRANVDSLIVINNNKLREVYGNLGFKAGFSKADEVMAMAARVIAELFTQQNASDIDTYNLKTILSNSGTAIMGSSTASGSGRAAEAIMKALDSPLLNDNKIAGAKNVLLLIVSGSEEITIDEIGEINDHIQIEAGHGANIIMGIGENDLIKDNISVTVIATGFNVEYHIGEAESEVQSMLKEEIISLEMDLIPTTRYIANFEVLYEEVSFQRYTDSEINDLVLNKYIEVIPELEYEKGNQIRYSLDDYLCLENSMSTSSLIEEIYEHNLEEKDDVFFNKKSPKHTKKTKVLSTKKHNTLRVLNENRIKSIFLKNEVLFMSFMAFFLVFYLFLINDWKNIIAFSCIFFALIVASYSLYRILGKRTKTLGKLILSMEYEAKSDLKNSPYDERDDVRRELIRKSHERLVKYKSSIEEMKNTPAYKRMGYNLKTIKIILEEDDSYSENEKRSNNSFLHDNVD